MFSEAEAWIFVQLISFQAPSSIFVSFLFNQVLMKDLVRMLIHVCKIVNCKIIIFQNAVVNVPRSYLERNLNRAVIN